LALEIGRNELQQLLKEYPTNRIMVNGAWTIWRSATTWTDGEAILQPLFPQL